MCLPLIFVTVEVLLVDADFFGQLRDVRDVDLDGAVAQGFHELVVQELLVLGLVGVADDDLVDVGLRELLRLDLVLLRRAEEIVEERDVELEDLDELEDAAVRDVELAVEVERARVAVGAVLGDLAVVDVARKLGRVLVLLVFRLEGADADAILLRERHAPHADVLGDDLRPVALVFQHERLEDEAAGRIEIAVDAHLELVVRQTKLVDGLRPPVRRDEPQRLLVHRAREPVDVVVDAGLGQAHPFEREERAVRRARVLLRPLLEEARDGALRGAHRPVQEDDALLRAVSLGGGLEHVHQAHQRDVEAEDGVGAGVLLVLEEVVTDELLLVVDVLLGPVADDHVVKPLVRVARHLRLFANDSQVLLEAAFPVQLAIQLEILHRGDAFGHVGQAGLGHRRPRSGRRQRAPSNHHITRAGLRKSRPGGIMAAGRRAPVSAGRCGALCLELFHVLAWSRESPQSVRRACQARALHLVRVRGAHVPLLPLPA